LLMVPEVSVLLLWAFDGMSHHGGAHGRGGLFTSLRMGSNKREEGPRLPIVSPKTSPPQRLNLFPLGVSS
jgi:hypothetical protein